VIVGDSLVSTFSNFFEAAANCSAMVMGLAALAPDNLILSAPRAPLGIAGGFATRFYPFFGVGYLIATVATFKGSGFCCSGALGGAGLGAGG
jgi:hypothetical protein